MHKEVCRDCKGHGQKLVPVWNDFSSATYAPMKLIDCSTCSGTGLIDVVDSSVYPKEGEGWWCIYPSNHAYYII